MGGYFPTLKKLRLPGPGSPDTIDTYSQSLHGKERPGAMIALLFALLTATMGLNFLGKRTAADALFFVTLAMSVYWLKFHATSELTIQL